MTTRIREIYWILGGLLAAASLASGIGYALARRRPADPAMGNLNARIRSWWVLIAVGGGALLAGRIAVIVLFAGLSFLALGEFLPRARGADRATHWVCILVALPVQYALAGLGWYGAFAVWIPVFCLPAVALVAALFSDTRQFSDRAAVTLWGLMVCAYSISHIPALMTLRIPGYERRTPILVVFLVLVAQASDILQYVWGRLIGRRRVAPVLSPSKTVEGLVGGVLSATLLGALLWPLTPFTMWQAGLMAFVIALLGFAGGLVLSAIKRDRGIKDWSRLIAGHGGVLDRIDSLCFSAPVFFYLTRHFFSRS